MHGKISYKRNIGDERRPHVSLYFTAIFIFSRSVIPIIMEAHLFQWMVLWAMLPTAFFLFWIWRRSVDKIRHRYSQGGGNVDYNKILELKSETLPDLYTKVSANKLISYQNRSDHKIKFGMMGEEESLKKIPSLKCGPKCIESSPPDIYVIDEDGQAVKYIMCV